MKSLRTIVCIGAACGAAWSEPGESVSGQEEARIRIGVLEPETRGGGEGFAAEANKILVDQIREIGFYTVVTQRSLEKAFTEIKAVFPDRCRDPRCVRDVGSAAGMDRMVYGTVDRNDKQFGVVLELLDVRRRRAIESVSLTADPGVGLEDLLHAAVGRLHGRVDDDIAVDRYFGPEVDNLRELYVSSGLCMAAGVVWGLVNGGFKGMGSEPSWASSYRDEDLSGIVTAGSHIPLSARPAALANSYMAVSDDAYGVLYNPAGMSWIEGREASLQYQYRFGMLNNLAATYVNKATREIGFGQAFLYNGDTEGLLTEVYFTSALSYKFNRFLPVLNPLSVGASVRLKSLSTPEKDSATAAQKTFGGGVDVGVLGRFSDRIRGAAVLCDVVSFERVNNTVAEYSYTEYQPVTLHLGGLFQAGYTTMLVFNGQVPLYEDQPWRMAGGIEQEMFRLVLIRAGIARQIQAQFDTPWIFTGGAGLQVNTESLLGRLVTVDASYEYNTLGVFDVLNISLRFGF